MIKKAPRISTLFTLLALLGCTEKQSGNVSDLNEAQAHALAIELANQECEQRYGVTPFDRSTSNVELRDGRWHWGGLDPHGNGGYSAEVSFDLRGQDAEVEIFFSTDEVQ